MLMAALSACGQDAGPAAPATDPSPTARPQAASQSSASTPATPAEDPSPTVRPQAASQSSTPTPAPPTTVPSPSLSPIPAAFSPGDRSDGAQDPYEAPDFSLATGFGPQVALGELLEDHDAVVLVFYRGFF